MQTTIKQTVKQTAGCKQLQWYWLCAILFMYPAWAQSADPIRVGIVSIDNYQGLAFTELFHNPPADNPALRGLKVVAAWPGGSPDLEESFTNVPRWKPLLQKQGVQMEDTIDAVLAQVDAVMLMTVDGRPHLAQVRPVLKAGKPVYIGRPMAASLEDVIEMFHLARRYKTPIFSSSQHRFSPGIAQMRSHPEVGEVTGCLVYGGCPTEPHHPDFFYHAIHSFESLYTIMGIGALSVTRARTAETELVTGVWRDGRIGTYRGIRQGTVQYSALVFGSKGIAPAGQYGYPAPVNGVVPKSRYKGYEGVATEIARFYKSRRPPVTATETIELFAFMEAAHESGRRGGAPVGIPEVIAQAQGRVARRLGVSQLDLP
ncbi:MAG: Gfo/Idh/MocA family oxidoreductase [Planctomycetota bacterium]|nr:Gfo/Idh/MocA family oxidoreductase [Planctomycetota bacterium]